MKPDDKASLNAHGHSTRRFYQTKTFRLLSMLSLTFTYFIVEIVVGNITNSVALVADAFHMLSDVISLVIAIVAVRISKRRSDINTYGWVRAEVVGANINTVFLLALCLTIVFDAIKRFIQPEPIENVNLLLIVGSVGLGINIIGLFLFQGFHGHSHGGGSSHGHSHGDSKHQHQHSHEHEHEHEHDSPTQTNNNPQDIELNDETTGNEITPKFERYSSRALQEAIAECANQTDEKSETVIDMDDNKTDAKEKPKSQKRGSMNMHGVFLHVLADALGSVVVIISALLIKFVPHDPESKKHWTIYIDPTLSVIIVIIIAISTISLFRETSFILLQAIPRNLEIHGVKSKLLENIPEIHSVHELHIWRLTDDKIIASAHLNRRNLSNYMSVADKVKKFFHSIGIHSITIQYEVDEYQRTNPEQQQQQTTNATATNENSTDKIAGDCLLRCENEECDTQTCCTKSSDRTNILVSNQATEIDSVSQPNQYDNPVFAQVSVDPSEQGENL